MEDPKTGPKPADTLDQQLNALLPRLAQEPVPAALTATALDLQNALKAAGKLPPPEKLP
ncbi:hypothetical protein [Pararhodobacter sp.]|jgi:hypothetical protein|uniref:hypothetical protein n=1 Tax=Pararhodobacter sp. TaxID=2127056 RepID=UPI002FDC7D0D